MMSPSRKTKKRWCVADYYDSGGDAAFVIVHTWIYSRIRPLNTQHFTIDCKEPQKHWEKYNRTQSGVPPWKLLAST